MYTFGVFLCLLPLFGKLFKLYWLPAIQTNLIWFSFSIVRMLWRTFVDTSIFSNVTWIQIKIRVFQEKPHNDIKIQWNSKTIKQWQQTRKFQFVVQHRNPNSNFLILLQNCCWKTIEWFFYSHTLPTQF